MCGLIDAYIYTVIHANNNGIDAPERFTLPAIPIDNDSSLNCAADQARLTPHTIEVFLLALRYALVISITPL